MDTRDKRVIPGRGRRLVPWLVTLALTVTCIRQTLALIVTASQSVEELEKRSVDVVVADVRRIPGEQTGLWSGDNSQMTIIRSFKGTIPEGKVIHANTFLLIFPPVSRTTSSSAELRDFPSRTRRLQELATKENKLFAGRHIIFLEDDPYVLVGPEKRPLNGNTWSALPDAHSIIPIGQDLSLELPTTATVREKVKILIDREWKRREKAGDLRL